MCIIKQINDSKEGFFIVKCFRSMLQGQDLKEFENGL